MLLPKIVYNFLQIDVNIFTSFWMSPHTVFKTCNDSLSKASNINAYIPIKMLLDTTFLTTKTNLSKIGIMIVNECLEKQHIKKIRNCLQ
jgi:hypothetical protein